MKYLLLLTFCLTSCFVTAQKENQVVDAPSQTNQNISIPQTQQKPEKVVSDIPKTDWERIFFEGINERTNEAGLKSLRKTHVAENDIDVRVWMGFGLSKLEGFILKRINKQWAAIHIESNYASKKFVSRNIKLNEPDAGWEKTWQELIDADILTLPDAESINCNPSAVDGFSYVVEIKKGINYRTYMYENPDMDFKNKCSEAEQIQKIIKIIFQDYKIK